MPIPNIVVIIIIYTYKVGLINSINITSLLYYNIVAIKILIILSI